MAEPFRAAVPAAIAMLVVLLAGCSVGDVPPYLQESEPGSDRRAGDILVRDAMFAFEGPADGGAVYLPGESVDVQATIVNRGDVPDRLVSVSSPVAAEGAIVGEAAVRGHHTLTAGYTDPLAAIAMPDTTRIVLRLSGLNTPIRAGRTYPVEFTFARAGAIRLELRVDTPDEPREACPLPPDGKVPKVFTAPLRGSPVPPTNPPPDCSSIPTSIPEVQVLDVEGPLTRPTWATEHDTLLGFVTDGGKRLVRVDPQTGETLGSRAAEDAGEDFGLVPTPDERVALPLTGSDRIALLDTESLAEVGSIGAVPAPSWVAVEPESQSLFALAEDGSTVTGVDHETEEVLFRREVRAGPEAVVAPGDHVDPSFWLLTPDGVTYFSGQRPMPEGERRVELSHETFSSDDAASKSAYFAAEGSNRVQLLEGDGRGGLEISQTTELSEPVEHVEAKPEEEYRVYAVTDTKLVSLKHDTLEVITSTEYRGILEQAGLGEAKVSGVTVGDDYVYLTVAGEPVVLKIRKEEP